MTLGRILICHAVMLKRPKNAAIKRACEDQSTVGTVLKIDMLKYMGRPIRNNDKEL